ncbi:MAG: FHA domain-containing protein [Polyangia bacterium]
MSVLRRLLSPTYRDAVRAEAEGRYRDAARAYALCGQREKVAEMHLLEAERRLGGTHLGLGLGSSGPGSGIDELRLAAHYLDGLDGAEAAPGGGRDGTPAPRPASAVGRDPTLELKSDGPVAQRLLRRIGLALLRALRRSGLIGVDRDAVHEVAQVLRRAGDLTAAATAYELIGDVEHAAALYEQLGDIDKVESLLGAQEQRRGRAQAEREHFERYRTALQLGQRDQALAALLSCVDVTPTADRAEPLRLLEELRARLITDGRVRLRGGDGGEVLYLGMLPVVIGRGDGCALVLRDPGVSRAHAQIESQPAAPAEPLPPVRSESGLLLRDLGAKNGTSLLGVALAPSSAVPLRSDGELGIGQHVVLGFQVSPGGPDDGAVEELRLRVLRGLDHGLCVRISTSPFRLDALELRFERGRPFLRARGSEGLLLNGQRAPREVQLLRGDTVELDGQRCEVR